MKLSKYFLILAFMFGSTLNAQELEAYKWENRILLLIGESKDTQALVSQLKRFTSLKAEYNERDLKLLIITNTTVFFDDAAKADEFDAKIIRRQLEIPENFKGVVLIGKDGGKKFQEKFEVNPQVIFDLIDGMPMRQAEMRKKGD